MNAEHEVQPEPIYRAYAVLIRRNGIAIFLTSPAILAAMQFALALVTPGKPPIEDAVFSGLGYGVIVAITLTALLYKKRLSEITYWTWAPSLIVFGACIAVGLGEATVGYVLMNVFATAFFARIFLTDVIYRAGWCPKCSYDLRGNVSGICPECGETVRDLLTRGPTQEHASLPAPPHSPLRWCLAIPAVLLALLIIAPTLLQ